MTNALTNSRDDIATAHAAGWYGFPSRRKQLLGKTIKALEKPSISNGPILSLVDPKFFRQMVAERAYLRAEQRGFEPGHEVEDWLAAEKELLAAPSYFLD